MKRERRGEVNLGVDLIERILLALPVSVCIKCASVCKLWYGLISAPAFSVRLHQSHAGKHPFLFLLASHHRQIDILSCMYDPLAARWFALHNCNYKAWVPSFCSLTSPLLLYPCCPSICDPHANFELRYALNPTSIRWTHSSPAPFERSTNIIVVTLFNRSLHAFKALVLTEPTPLHLYDSAIDQWEICKPPVVGDMSFLRFKGEISHAVRGCKIFFAHISSRQMAYFNVDSKLWTSTSNLRIDLEIKRLLITSTDKGLYALGLCVTAATICIKLFNVNEVTFECKEVSIMPVYCPRTLAHMPGLFSSSCECLGSGNLIYVEWSDVSNVCYWLCEVDKDYKWHQLPSPGPVLRPGFRAKCCSFELLPEACLGYQHS